MNPSPGHERLLLRELRWLIGLRWVAGAGLLALGALAPWLFPALSPALLVGAGLAVLACNAGLAAMLRPWRSRGTPGHVLLGLALAQIVLDLLALTLVVAATGGIDSPAAGFYVFHMVFASLLLPRALAYSCALLAVALFFAAVGAAGPAGGAAEAPTLRALGWCATVVVTVLLAEHITRSLYRREWARLRLRRRARLASAALVDQQRSLVQHDKMISMGRLAAGVAHEIVNPLANMDSVLQLMARSPDTPRPEAVASLREQIARIQSIVRRLTTFAHPDTGHPEQTDLSESVRAAMRMLALDHRLRKVRVEQRLAPEPVLALAAPRALQQVVMNLVTNALDALEGRPEPVLSIRTGYSGADGLIEVEDNGPGIDPAHLARVFEPFFTTKPVGRGTGLGLSISRSLVREQGGDIEVRSQPGKGATFRIRVPAQAPTRAPAPDRAP